MNKISEIDHERIAMMIRCRMESKDVGPVQLAAVGPVVDRER